MKNCGTAAARNRGNVGASSDYVALFESDAVWLPQKLQVQMIVRKGIAISHNSVFGLLLHRFREAMQISSRAMRLRCRTGRRDLEGLKRKKTMTCFLQRLLQTSGVRKSGYSSSTEMI